MQVTLDIYNASTAVAVSTASVLIVALVLWARGRK
jgi:hypothetical protein